MHSDLIISKDTLVIDVLEMFDENDTGIFVLSEGEENYEGYILDRVLRSLALNKDNLFKPVGEFSLNNFCVLDTSAHAYSGKKLENFSLVIEKSGFSIERLYGPVLSQMSDIDLKQVPVVVMAGGRGERLRPITDIIPKPLLPIDDKAVLEVIIDSFYSYGVRDFYLTLNYMANFIKAYMTEFKHDYAVHYIEESKPLGTAGALKYLQQKVDRPFFVSNCDTLIRTSYKKLYDFHLRNKFDLTIVGAIKKVQIPFGICEVDSDFSLIRMHEKPSSYHIINTGVYVVSPQALDVMPVDRFYDITDFISDLKKAGKRIGVYPISQNSWINLGSLDDFHKNREKLL